MQICLFIWGFCSVIAAIAENAGLLWGFWGMGVVCWGEFEIFKIGIFIIMLKYMYKLTIIW